ncbi:MAG: hypothetical protein WC002_09160 [Candidatus Muiribacteriota bacterium]
MVVSPIPQRKIIMSRLRRKLFKFIISGNFKEAKKVSSEISKLKKLWRLMDRYGTY